MWKNGHFMATAMTYNTGEHCITVHTNRHYLNFPGQGNMLGYLMGEGL